MKLKVLPEDFIVCEVVDIEYQKLGNFKIYELEKRNVETFDFLGKFSKDNNVNFKDIGVWGIKDKNAITTQLISIPTNYKLKNEIFGKNFKLCFKGFLDAPLKPGMLIGNNFTITIRDLELKHISEIKNYIKNIEKSKFEYIKKELFSKEFQNLNLNIPYFEKLKFVYRKTGSFKETYRAIPIKLREIIINVYQSYLFNECVKLKISQKYKSFFVVKYDVDELFFPKNLEYFDFNLIGRGVNDSDVEIIIIDEILKIEELVYQDFRSLSKSGSFLLSEVRAGVVYPKDVKFISSNIDYNSSSENHEKYYLKLSFFLPKVSYATILIKEITKSFEGIYR